MELSRRHLLTLGALGTLALAGCAPRPSPSPSPTLTPSGSPSPSVGGPPDWDALAQSLGDRLLRPGSDAYRAAVPTEIPVYDGAAPPAIVRARDAGDVATAVSFAAASGLRIAVRSGGHNYAGWSSGGGGNTGLPEELVINVRALDAVEVDAGTGIARIGAGAPLALVYEKLAGAGRAIGGGSCGSVGIGGLASGGGVGVLARAFGLTSDQVAAIDIVTPDGKTRTVDAQHDPDIFWACRGGGGGLLGVVTAFHLNTKPAPGVTMYFLSWDAAAAPAVIAAWQEWAPRADPQLWSTLKLLTGSNHPTGASLSVSGTWIGPVGGHTAALAGLLGRVPAPTRNQATRHEYLDAMMRYAGCAGSSAAECVSGPGGKLIRTSFAATSGIATRALSATEIAAVIQQTETLGRVSGVTEGGFSFDALGGVIDDVAADATAFGHRGALFSAQYTANFADGANPDPFHQAVRALRAVTTAAWGPGAYVNYPDARLESPATAYFGDNAARLRKVRASIDPRGVFPAWQLG
ncbi:FAD-binding oxidoreductase [Mycetocola tolaasinivorans]|uniref:FAD-binding oxidoreductase n=1 Tax=Mycetocola tolaasinivorans TaxID=76635 RepID=A0A3L7A3V0_9MICO|nr:FAD-binding protein [Mycetocola tolaasinivorans]RLP74794.1 FAD-binding oxidoreductase [Mycetocola tolaasinivorans]